MVFATFLAFAVLAAPAGDPFAGFPPHLSPCDSFVGSIGLELELRRRVHAQLGLEPPVDSAGFGYPEAEVMRSSDDSEALAILFVPQGSGPVTLEVRESSANIWEANTEPGPGPWHPTVQPVLVPITVKRVEIQRDLAKRILAVLEAALMNVRYPTESVVVTHGFRFEFTKSYKCGLADSPGPESPILPLVDLWHTLIELPSLPESDRSNALATATRLVSLLEAHGQHN